MDWKDLYVELTVNKIQSQNISLILGFYTLMHMASQYVFPCCQTFTLWKNWNGTGLNWNGNTILSENMCDLLLGWSCKFRMRFPFSITLSTCWLAGYREVMIIQSDNEALLLVRSMLLVPSTFYPMLPAPFHFSPLAAFLQIFATAFISLLLPAPS